MAREYGKLFTSAWGDGDYIALGRGPQHLFLQLISQPDLSMSGSLTLAPVRWAGQASTDEGTILKDLETLEAKHFAVVDHETQEVLIRSFIRRDLGWRSPTTMKSIASSCRAVLSQKLKRALAEELRRLDLGSLPTKVNERSGKTTQQVVTEYVDGLLAEFDTLPDTPSKQDTTPHAMPHQIPHAQGGAIGDSLISHATATEPAPANAPANAPAPATRSAPTHVDDAAKKNPPHQAITKNIHDRVGGAINFAAVMGIVKWATTNRPETYDRIEDACVNIYNLGKPITKQTLGQMLDGKFNRPQNNQRPNRVQQNMEVVRELAARNQQPQPPQPEWKEIER